jgi:hypothetical protein
MKNILMIGLVLMAGCAEFSVLPAQVQVRVAQPNGNIETVILKPVTGAPFSAVATTESIQPLVDGNRIVHKNQEKLYRDSQGRERRESEGASFTVLGQLMAAGDVVIFEPAENASYSFNLQGNTAAKKLSLSSLSSGLQLAITGNGRAGVKEQLPPAVIEGLATQGQRSTTTIPAGEIGNERDILVVDEVWYSPDLQMNLITKHIDPRGGETTLRITNIIRSEPDPALFQVPKGFTVTGGAQVGNVINSGGVFFPKYRPGGGAPK